MLYSNWYGVDGDFLKAEVDEALVAATVGYPFSFMRLALQFSSFGELDSEVFPSSSPSFLVKEFAPLV